ncbi:MAG: polysaccharide biosynthesis protein [Ruminococcaceae bacterium]|nr:polysaccharide biosynthesis protein [Oscillospiraceae bacterium]
MNNKCDLRNKPKSAKNLFFSGVLVLTLANFLVKAVGLISKIALNRVVGSIGAGYYSSAYEIYAYLYVISTAGLPVALSIMIAKSRSKGRLLETKKIFDIAIILFLIIGFAFSIIMIAFSKQLSQLIGAPETSLCIVAIAPTMLFICLSSCMRGYFQGYQLMAPTAISQFIEAISKVLIGISLALWAKSKGCEDNVVASYTILGVTAGVLLGMIFLYIRKIFFKEERFFSLNEINKEKRSIKEILKEMLAIAIPVTISSSVLSLTTILDTIMVQNRLLVYGMNEIAVRIYYGDYTSLVISMFNLPTIILYPIANALVPMITSAHERKDIDAQKRMRSFSFRFIVIIALPCAMGLGVFSRQILQLLMFRAESVERASPWLAVASASVLFLGIIAITNSFLNSVGKQRLPIMSMLAGASVKLVSNYILLAKIGVMGAPISTVLCYLTASTINIIFVVKYVGNLPGVFKTIVLPLLCSVTSIGASAFLNRFISSYIPSSIATILSIFIAVFLYLVLILRTKTVSESELAILFGDGRMLKMLRKLKILP